MMPRIQFFNPTKVMSPTQAATMPERDGYGWDGMGWDGRFLAGMLLWLNVGVGSVMVYGWWHAAGMGTVFSAQNCGVEWSVIGLGVLVNLLVGGRIDQLMRGQLKTNRMLRAELSRLTLKLEQQTMALDQANDRCDHELQIEKHLADERERQHLDQMQDEFIAIVSHELRTPLTSAHGALKILVSGLVSSDSDQGQQLLKIAANSTDRLVRLINDILDIEKINAPQKAMMLANCPVKPLLQEVLRSLQPYATETGVKLHLEMVNAPDSLMIWADHDRLVQVLMNLINNAIQFSPVNGTVWLQAEPCGTQVQFLVKDQGHGIPSEKLEKVFERFQQVDFSSARHHEGSGLGLAICRSIVLQHQGKIWLESKVGEGSTFYFTIPIDRV
jgi:signal transduction histidine kinase